MNNYWVERALEEEKKSFNRGKKYFGELKKIYKKSFDKIDKKIKELEAEIATNEAVLSDLEANKLLNSEAVKSFKSNLKNNLKSYENLANSINYKSNSPFEKYRKKTLENIGKRANISRLKAYQAEIEMELLRLSKEVENSFINHLEDEFKNVYKGAGYDNKISGVDKKTIEKALQNSWVADGKTFSDRIWANSDRIIRDITQNIAINIASGQGVGTLSKEIAKKYNVLLWQASRLVQTETAAIKSKATLQRYEDDEIEFYQILVTNDERTSDICKKFLNSDKVYKLKEAQIGVNYPPFHVNCRSTTIAYFEDLDDNEDKSTAEDKNTPKMSYKEREGKYLAKMGGISGALNDKNDPNQKERERHAKMYYKSVVNRDKNIEINKILDTAKKYSITKRLEYEDIEKVYNHLFVNKYLLNGKIKTFDSDFYISVSWQRLREGKNIKYHDLILLLHERLEYDYMNLYNFNYDEAHEKTNLKYNYQVLVKEIMDKGEN